MRRKTFVIVARIAAVVCALVASLVAYASYRAESAREIPYPAVRAGSDAQAIARGATIFHASCESCHRPAGGGRASGAPLADAPAWLGALQSANLTSHASAGIGAVRDPVLGRTIRHGVDREGRWIPMPAYALSDADLAAVIGFLRSNDALFRPDPRVSPRSRLSLAGKVALFLAGTFAQPPAARAVAPAPAPTIEYGRYLAESVYQCGDCHTPGFDRDKLAGTDAYTGGLELKNAAGETVYSPNLTRDEDTGLGAWTSADFARALREGVRPDGVRLGPPMPRLAGATDVEIEALFAYLRSFPPQRRASLRASASHAQAR